MKLSNPEKEPRDDFRVAIPDESFQFYLREIGVTVENGTVEYGEIKNIKSIECSHDKISNISWVKGIRGGWKIKSLEGLSYFRDLVILDCSGNELTHLDVSNNSNLIKLGCGSNQLASLDVSRNINLNMLGCWDNELTSLDLSNNKSLNKLWCFKNRLLNLDVSQNLLLTDLLCSNNPLTTLNLSVNIYINFKKKKTYNQNEDTII
jgi:hypothetical protein